MAKFRQGATHRPLRAIAFTELAMVDFVAEFPGGVTFKMTSGATVITGAAVGDAVGNLTYQWATHDLDTTGTYAAHFTATDGAGRKEVFPTDNDIEIVVW